MTQVRYTHPSGLDVGEQEAFRLYSPAADDVLSYPKRWLMSATPAEIAALGLTRVEVPDPIPGPTTPVDPLTIPLSRRQLRIGLLNLGATWEAVLAYAAALPDPVAAEATLILLEESEEYNRGHPLFASIPAAFGLTDAQIDAEWAQAVDY